jgi:hypothetical protein
MTVATRKPHVLMILDGFGHREAVEGQCDLGRPYPKPQGD